MTCTAIEDFIYYLMQRLLGNYQKGIRLKITNEFDTDTHLPLVGFFCCCNVCLSFIISKNHHIDMIAAF